MPTATTLTLAEASQVLDPPMSEQQLRAIVSALGWQPEGWRRTGKPGHPMPAYQAADLLRLHAAMVPFMGHPGISVKSAAKCENRDHGNNPP